MTATTTATKPPFAKLDLATPGVQVDRRPDGCIILRSNQALEAYPKTVGAMLRANAAKFPERPFLAERTGGPGSPWRTLRYGEFADQVHRLAQAFHDLGLTADRPVMLLSDNAIDHALVQVAAMEIGAPAAPISPAYSLMSQDHGKLKYIFDLLKPGLVYAADGMKFQSALKALGLGGAGRPGVTVAVSSFPPPTIKTTLLADMLQTTPRHAVERAFAAIGPDTVAKILFTSGSTGMPKGVINTQRMLTSNQQAALQLWRCLGNRPPVIVDWLPWNHTFGGNHNFNMVLYNGGTYYIDFGKPAPGAIEHTLANLREISPTVYYNVPRGYDVLIPYLRADKRLREMFFRDLDFIMYAGAALPPNLWAPLEELAIQVRGERVHMLSSWGSTETAPMATTVYYPVERAGVIGLPAPGTEIKLAPVASKLEMRVKGPNVTPGYWRQPELTKAAFDEDGFFKMGDAGVFADPEDPTKGLMFDGRTAENFKLMSGTWVHVGELRLAAIAAGAPVIQDAVVAGHDREIVGLLIFPNVPACRTLAKDAPADLPVAELVRRPEIRAALERGLAAYNAKNKGSSRFIARALIMAEPPSIDANEITDKGYINQRAVVERRRALVERLFAPNDPEAIDFATKA
ncbi:MAG: feruloyl-CoA synthase [Candidatus Eiseniibacteriota bacterium]